VSFFFAFAELFAAGFFLASFDAVTDFLAAGFLAVELFFDWAESEPVKIRLRIRTTKDSFGAINFMFTSGERVVFLGLRRPGALEKVENAAFSLAFAKKLSKTITFNRRPCKHFLISHCFGIYEVL
jgi:hypothetical protein